MGVGGGVGDVVFPEQETTIVRPRMATARRAGRNDSRLLTARSLHSAGKAQNKPTEASLADVRRVFPRMLARKPLRSFDIQMEHVYSIGMPNRKQAKADVLQGTLDLMVLQTLDTLGPLHGYAIAARLEQVSAGALRLNMGTLYPA